tara:strand:- start:3949 stop:4350 length:402 start_codon:yes stop_codon:yes gene_type:complete
MVSDKFRKSILINSVLLVTDLGAGLILYNYGKSKGKKVSFSIPPGMELWSMCAVAAVTSLLTGAALTKLENHLKVEIFDETDQAFLDPNEWEGIFTSFKGLKIGQGLDNTAPPLAIGKFLSSREKPHPHEGVD